MMTNTPPNGAFRGFGAPQTQFAAEVHMDRIAEALNLDPVRLREINADLAAALKDPVVLTALEKMGATPVGNSPSDFDAFMRAEAAKWEPVLKEANIKMQ